MKSRFLMPLMVLLLTACVRRVEVVEPPQYDEPQITAEALYKRIQREGKRDYRSVIALHEKQDKVESISKSVPVGDIENGRLMVRTMRGAFYLEGGTDELLEADISYFKGDKAPDIFSVTGGSTRRVEMVGLTRDNLWKLKVNNHIPISVLIEAEEGYRELHFNDLLLTDLNLEATGGATLFSATGQQNFLSDVNISQARGSVGLEMGGDYDILESIHLDTGAGDLATALTGFFPRLKMLQLITTAGDVEADFNGAFKRMANVRITATDGDVTLFIPRGLGASVKLRGECAKIYAPCMTRVWSSGAFINDAYEKTEAFLDIEVHMTGGLLHVVETNPRQPIR